jgi:hypothetical protein
MKLTNEQLYQWFRVATIELLRTREETFPEKPDAKLLNEESISGLKQAINDLLAMTRHGSVPASFDRRLLAAGLPGIEEMRNALKRKEAGILKRGVIRNDEEYYLVREILNDVDLNIRPKTIERLGHLITQYESRPQNT